MKILDTHRMSKIGLGVGAAFQEKETQGIFLKLLSMHCQQNISKRKIALQFTF